MAVRISRLGRRAKVFASLLLFASFACVGMPDDEEDSVAPIGDGFRFDRDLQPTVLLLDGSVSDDVFRPERYAAYTFPGQQGVEVDLLSWTDWSWSDHSFWRRRVSHALFVWAPLNGSDNTFDGRNWALLRTDVASKGTGDEGSVGYFKGTWEHTRMILPETNQYLLLVLTTERNDRNGEPYHVSARVAQPDDAAPGTLRVMVSYYDEFNYSTVNRTPVVGERVAIGSSEIYTNVSGEARFENLPPNEYTVKLGPDGYEQRPTIVRSGEVRRQAVWLERKL